MNEISQKLKLPEGWKWVRLGEVLQGQNERTGRKELSPVAIGIKGVRERDEIYYKDLAEDYSNNKLFKYGFVAFGLGSDEIAVGVNIYREDHCVSPAYKVFKILNEDILFFHYYMNFIKRLYGNKFLMVSARQGKNVDFKWFIQEHVSLPPLPEQQKIAEILETVDNAIEKTDAIIEKYKRIKKGLMQELLTKGIDENGKIRDEKTHHFKASPLGRIPEEWKVTRLGEIASKEKYSFVDGPFGSNLKTVHYTTSGILVIQSNYFTKGKFNVINPTFTTEEKANELLRSNTKPSDIVIAKIGANYGAVAIIPETITRAVLSGNTMKITLDKNIANNVYVCFYLGYFKETDKINRILAAGSAQPALSLYGYKNLKIPLPPLPEQQRIAAILSQIDEVIEKETQYRDKLKRLKAGLMQDLLTGKVRVNKLIKQGA